MNEPDTADFQLEHVDWFAQLTGPDWVRQRADLKEHLRLLEVRLSGHATTGQTSEAWVRLQASRNAVRYAIEIIEGLPAPSS